MGRSDFLYARFLANLSHTPTVCQDNLMRKVADFVSSDDDILVVNGYAGTGKTTAMASVITTLKEFQTKCVLLAPTGRAAKVLASYAGQQAFTIHKHIYRQKSVGGDGFGQFTLSPNKDKETLFIVDEVSLIGIDAGQQQSTSVFGSGNLLEDLVSFVRSGVECKVILIGDSAQLPPVGLDASPALLRDYMAMMGGVSFVELTTVVRQQNESGILHNATNLRHHIADLDCGPGVMDICDLGLETGFVVHVGHDKRTDTYDQRNQYNGQPVLHHIRDHHDGIEKEKRVFAPMYFIGMFHSIILPQSRSAWNRLCTSGLPRPHWGCNRFGN